MPSAFESLCGPGRPLKAEPPDANEFAGLKRSGLARLKDAGTKTLSLEGRFDLAYNAAHALCLAALRWHGYRSGNRYIVFQLPPDVIAQDIVSKLAAALEPFRLIAADLREPAGAPERRTCSTAALQAAPCQLRKPTMTLCPIAIVAGCKKCPAFGICPLKGALGDQVQAPADKPAKPKSKTVAQSKK